MKLSQRTQGLDESATLAITRRAGELKASGVDVITFGAGQPDFPTPPHICQKAQQAIQDGHTGYAVPSSGLVIAKEAVRLKFKRENNLDYQTSQIIITVGAKEALYLAFMSLLSEGDEVILPAPYWVSFPAQINLAGGKAVVVQGDPARSFRLAPQQLQDALSPRTRGVVLNYPNNPGGFTYEREELLGLFEVLRGKDIFVFADELYDRQVYGGHTHSSWAALNEEAYSKTLTVNAVSKSYSMTGWRLGYAAGPIELISAMAKLQGQITTGAANFAQHALVAALTGDQNCVEQMRCEFDRRRRFMYERLVVMPGVSCVEPMGAFYCFPDVSCTYDKLGVRTSVEFSQCLLDEAHVAVVPGSAFGCDGHVRLAYAMSEAAIRKGLDRIGAWLAKT